MKIKQHGLFSRVLISAMVTSLGNFAIAAETWKAQIFEINKTKSAPLFLQETTVDTLPGGERQFSSVIKDPQGQLIMTEKALFQGDRVLSQRVEQWQLKEAYELKSAENKITFLTYNLNEGKDAHAGSIKNETRPEDFITGPGLEAFLRAHWSELLEGKSLKASFGVFELAKTVGFQFNKMGGDGDLVKIRMKPANIFISLFVDPIDLEIRGKDLRLLRYRGRTPLRIKSGDSWKSLDAEVVYEYH
jgi:hypothetical protein